MESEKVAGILSAIVASIILVIAFVYSPAGPWGKSQAPVQQKIEAPKAPPGPPPPRGPVVREVPQ